MQSVCAFLELYVQFVLKFCWSVLVQVLAFDLRCALYVSMAIIHLSVFYNGQIYVKYAKYAR